MSYAVTHDQIEAVTQQYYDVVEADYFGDRPEEVRAGYIEVMHKAMVNAGIPVLPKASERSDPEGE